MRRTNVKSLPLEIIFDYACPYCYKAHLYLKEIRTEFPELEMMFSPCEAHPRPERWSPHSDLALRGMYYYMEQGMDIWEYHDLIYRAFHVERINTEDLNILAEYLREVVDAEDFRAVLQRGEYEDRRLAANQYAWGTLSLHAVPSYRMGKHILKAVEGIGVTRQMLIEFIRKAYEEEKNDLRRQYDSGGSDGQKYWKDGTGSKAD